MNINLHITRNKKEDEEFRATLVRIMAHTISTLKEMMMASNSELVTRLQGVQDMLTKVHLETSASVKMIADLRAELGAGGISEEAMAKLDAIEAQLKATDDLVADAEPVPGQTTIVVEGSPPPPSA